MRQPGHRQHSRTCRKRLYDLMTKDPGELDRINWNEARMGRDAARNESIPRSPEPMSVGHAAKGGRGDNGPPAPAPQASAPSSDAVEIVEGGVEIPVEDDDSSEDIKLGYV